MTLTPLRRRRLLLLLAAASACRGRRPASVPQPGPPPANDAQPTVPFEVVDLVPAFLRFWEDAKGLPTSKARGLFLDTVVRDHPNVYAPNVLGYPPGDEEALHARIDAWLEGLPEYVGRIATIHAEFASHLRADSARFIAELPDFDWDGQVYLMASVDSFNGAGRRVGDRGALLFGLDVIARSTPEANPSVLMHHELFHVYQAAQQGVLGEAMWVEGLATFASIQLNPGTSDGSALPASHVHDPSDPQLDVPARRVDWPRDMPRYAAELGRELREKIHSRDPDDYATFFLGRASDALGKRPVRSAYWFGLQIARALCGDRPLRELAKRPPSEFMPQIERELSRIIDLA